MARTATALLAPDILVPALGSAFAKLDPRALVRNPVMFVVEVVALLTTVLFLRDLATGAGGHRLLLPDRALALVHPALRQLRRSRRRGPRQGAGGEPQGDPHRHRREAPQGSRAPRRRRGGPGAQPRARRRGARRGGRPHPLRRRGDRGRRFGQRGGDHRRIRPGHPRIRRRPLGRHRRHPGAVRLDRGADHRRPGLDLPRPDDRPDRRRAAAEDPERDRAQHPARRAHASSSSSPSPRSRASRPTPAARSGSSRWSRSSSR